MAEEKILNTRIVLKNDSLANWNSSKIVLKKGEIALAAVESVTEGNYNVPTYLMKVGDGVSAFTDLKWVAAAAADVYAWAKLENPTIDQLPGNLKTAITNLQSAVGSGGSVAESIQAAIGALELEDTAVANQFVTAVSQENGKIAVTRAALTAANIPVLGIEKINGLQAILDEKATVAALNDYKTSNNAAVKANADAIAAITDGETIDSFADVETALAGKQAAGDYATRTEAQGYADAKDTAIAAAKKAGDDAAAAAKAAQNAADAAQDSVDALSGQVGTVGNLTTTNKTVVGAINEVKTAVATSQSASEITLDTTTTTSGALKSYTIKQGGSTVGVIDIPKDMVVQSGEVVVNPTGQPAGTYIKLTLANAANDVIYINVGTLVDIYTAAAAAPQVQIAINPSTREISATIVAESIGTDELADNAITTAKVADGNITKAKLATDVQASLTKADNAATAAALTDEVDRAKAAEAEALTSAKAYTDTVSATATTTAKSYADGLIDALDSSVAATAGSVLTGITMTNGKIIGKTEKALAAIATTGSTDDLVQGANTLIFDCGTASTVI